MRHTPLTRRAEFPTTLEELMDFGLTKRQRDWRNAVRDFIAHNLGDDLADEIHREGADANGPAVRRFRAALAERGWLGVMWPEEMGGLGMGATEFYILREELDYQGLAEKDLTYTAVAPMIMRHGTAENQEDWLPRLRRGEMVVTVGYSEPESGTDLASMNTRAVLDGDEWVINGQKLWNSGAHVATHEWLCVRTDPDAPKHRGLSVIMVPIDTPGIEVQGIETWADERTNVTFFTDVRVPRRNLIGEMNRGWQYITGALDLERLAVGHVGSLRRSLDDLQDFCLTQVLSGRKPAESEWVVRSLAELEAALEAAYLVGLQAASQYDAGEIPTIAATEHKVLTSELRQRMGDLGMQMLEMHGQLDWQDTTAPMRGAMERLYRESPLMRFGGGANEVLRDVLAQRGEGLPSYGRSPAPRVSSAASGSADKVGASR